MGSDESLIMDCPHGMSDVNFCTYCAPLPIGIKSKVYITKSGGVFHNDRDCPLLRSGQSSASSQGLKNYDVEVVSFGRTSERGACHWCCALFNALQKDFFLGCFIREGDEWVNAYFLASRVIAERNGKKYYEHKVTKNKESEFCVSNMDIRITDFPSQS
jgi:hypothetical protein